MKSNEKFTFYKKCRWKKYFEVWSEKLTTINFCLSLVLKFQEKKTICCFFLKRNHSTVQNCYGYFFFDVELENEFPLELIFFLFCPVKFKKKILKLNPVAIVSNPLKIEIPSELRRMCINLFVYR